MFNPLKKYSREELESFCEMLCLTKSDNMDRMLGLINTKLSGVVVPLEESPDCMREIY